MTDTLLDAVRRYTQAHAALRPGPDARARPDDHLFDPAQRAWSRHLAAARLPGAAGSKQVTLGTRTFSFEAGDSLLITADVPTVSQITRASDEAPYLSLVLDLDPAVIAELASADAGRAAARGRRP